MFKLFSKSKPAYLEIRPDSNHCISLYHKNAGCRRCKDVCTENAVIIGRPGTVISIREENCINCGKCFGVCTHGAFRKSGTTEEGFCSAILEKINKNHLRLSCNENNTAKCRIECIGGLNAVHLLWLLIRGASSISLYYGACGECRLLNGDDMIRNQIESVKGFCSSLKDISLTVEYGENSIIINAEGFPDIRKTGGVDMSRRAFFRHMGREVASGLSNTVEVLSSQELNKVDFSESAKKRSIRHMLFRNVLAALWDHIDKPLRYDRNLPMGEINVDHTKCDSCGLCAQLCPTGSLKRENKRIEHCVTYCSGCQICVKTCTEGCLTLKEFYTPA